MVALQVSPASMLDERQAMEAEMQRLMFRLEDGFEKVYLYMKLGKPTHAARQLCDGSWTSKLGKNVDISHELDGLKGNKYGHPTVYLRRPKGKGTDTQGPTSD